MCPLLTLPCRDGGSRGEEQETLSRNQDPCTNLVLGRVFLCSGDIKKATSTRSQLLEAQKSVLCKGNSIGEGIGKSQT